MDIFGLYLPVSVGVLAGIIGLLAFVPDILEMIYRDVKPNRATWMVWAVLSVVLAASYYSTGATESAWVPIVYAFGITVVAIFSLKYGERGWSALDTFCLLGAGVGLALWWITNDPFLALYIAIVVDAIGAIPTLNKTYARPRTESRTAWLMFLAAAGLNLFAIGEWTLSEASYPVYLFLLSVVMVALLLRKPKEEKNAGKTLAKKENNKNKKKVNK